MNQRTVEETRGKSIQTYVTATAVALQLNHPPKWMNLFRSFSNLGWLFYCKDHILVSMYRHPSSTILDVYINLVDIKYKSRYIFVLEQLITVHVNITPNPLSPEWLSSGQTGKDHNILKTVVWVALHIKLTFAIFFLFFSWTACAVYANERGARANHADNKRYCKR